MNDLEEDLKGIDVKEFWFSKPDCAYCKSCSVGVFGLHYICDNKNATQYGTMMPLCTKDCKGYRKK